MKKVINNASPIKTWFGGICCVASDVLTKDKMTITLVKHVIKIKMPGANDNTVKSKINLTDVEMAEGSELENILIKSDMFIIFLVNLIH